MKIPKALVYGRDYDGWALPLEREKGPPYFSHFVGSKVQPELPKGCVPVKISQVYFVVAKSKQPDVEHDESE